MFCSICYKQKKSKKTCESHIPRNCPILRAHQCNKCFKTGHFEDHCVEIAKKYYTSPKKQKASADGWSTPVGFNQVTTQVTTPATTPAITDDVIDESPCVGDWRVGFDWAIAMGC